MNLCIKSGNCCCWLHDTSSFIRRCRRGSCLDRCWYTAFKSTEWREKWNLGVYLNGITVELFLIFHSADDVWQMCVCWFAYLLRRVFSLSPSTLFGFPNRLKTLFHLPKIKQKCWNQWSYAFFYDLYISAIDIFVSQFYIFAYTYEYASQPWKLKRFSGRLVVTFAHNKYYLVKIIYSGQKSRRWRIDSKTTNQVADKPHKYTPQHPIRKHTENSSQ